MSDPYQRQDLSNCGTERLCVANNCGVLSVNYDITIFEKQLQVNKKRRCMDG